MKIERTAVIRGGSGSIRLTPMDSDDIDFAYHLISQGDYIMADTMRKVVKKVGDTGKKEAVRKIVRLEVQVEQIADLDNASSVLRVSGKNILSNEFVKIGAFHTFELELNHPFVLRKDVWDSSSLNALQQASDHKANSADLAVIWMQEGLADIILVGETTRTACSQIKNPIPRKQARNNESASNAFFDTVLQAFLKHVDFNVVRCAVIASQGTTKDQFHRHLLSEAERRKIRAIIENKSRIKLVQTTSYYNKHSLREVLQAPNVTNTDKDGKMSQEVRALQEYLRIDSKDPTRACYGPKDVEVAHEYYAVQTLLITEDLLRNGLISTREKYFKLVKSVKKSGGTVHVFSSSHSSVEELVNRTGIAAILRFPLPYLEDMHL